MGSLVTWYISIDEMLKASDDAVYLAKKKGRNQTVIWWPGLRDRRSA